MAAFSRQHFFCWRAKAAILSVATVVLGFEAVILRFPDLALSVLQSIRDELVIWFTALLES
jgi:hypothetical protein